jgi:hypothetical protein
MRCHITVITGASGQQPTYAMQLDTHVKLVTLVMPVGVKVTLVTPLAPFVPPCAPPAGQQTIAVTMHLVTHLTMHLVSLVTPVGNGNTKYRISFPFTFWNHLVLHQQRSKQMPCN